MARENVKFVIPERSLVNENARFLIFRNKKKLGEIRISRGGFDYFPQNKKITIKLKWIQFDKLFRKEFDD